jgi:O-antigen/teichoic acid export membrane protein
MTARSSFFSNAAIYTISNFAVAVVPFLLLPLMTHVLSPEDYGRIAMFTVFSSFLFVFVGFNTHGAVMVRFFEPDKFSIPDYVTTVLAILAATTIMVTIIVGIFSEQLQAVTAIPGNWLILAVAVAALQFLVQTLLTLWQSSRQPGKYGALRLNHAIMDGSVSVALVVGLHYSWTGRVSGIALAWAVTAVIAVFFLRREGWTANRVDPTYAKDALRYGVPLAPHAVGGLLLGLADRFLVTNLLDVSSTGVYLAATQIGMVLGITADAVNKAFAPWLMQILGNAKHVEKSQIVRNTYVYFVVIILLAASGALLAPHIIPVILGKEFQQSSDFIVFLFFGNAFIGMYYMVTNYIFYSRRTELLSALTIVVGVVSVAISWVLIREYGLRGAAIGFMAGQGLLFLGAWALAQFCHPMPWLKFRTHASD